MAREKSTLLKVIEPVDQGVTADQVAMQLRDLIERGELKRGERLPSERSLAKHLGISRPTLRAGLSSLVSKGVLQTRPGSGTYVADGPPELDSDQLKLLAALHGFTFNNMFEARRMLEVNVAGLAAERATGDQLVLIADELTGMYATLTDPQQHLIHDIKFHRAIAAASGNPILATLVEMVSAVMYEWRKRTVEREFDIKDSADTHQRIYQAIRDHRPKEARSAMQAHLLAAQEVYGDEETLQSLFVDLSDFSAQSENARKTFDNGYKLHLVDKKEESDKPLK